MRDIAARLRAAARYGDVAARLGGDEFGVILHNVADHDDGLAPRRYLGAFDEPSTCVDCSGPGGRRRLVAAAQESVDSHSLMRDADLAMHEAQRAGGGQIPVYEPEMHDIVVSPAIRQLELRQALSCDQFVLHYQL